MAKKLVPTPPSSPAMAERRTDMIPQQNHEEVSYVDDLESRHHQENDVSVIPQQNHEEGSNRDDPKGHRHQENGEPVISQDNNGKEKTNAKRPRMKALMQFRSKLEDAILGNYLLGRSDSYRSLSQTESDEAPESQPPLKDISLWGVPLLPSMGHEGTDVVLMKFLKARDYKVPDAFVMLQETLKWRREQKLDDMVDDPTSLPCEVDKMMYMRSTDKEGHPLCYHVYGVLEDCESCNRTLGTKEKIDEFVKCVVRFMERSIKTLSFKDGGVDAVVHVTDLKNMQSPSMKEIRSVLRSTFLIFQEHYPELIHRHIIINVPLWYYTFHMLLLRFAYQSNKSKFILARPAKVAKTLLKYIKPEDLPVEYGGLMRENDDEFSPLDKASELIVKGNSTSSIRISAPTAGETVVWDFNVVGWDVSYKEEFIPEDECSYTVLLQKSEKFGESVRNSFYINEPGEAVITIRNPTYKKKRVLFRSKFKPTPMYFFNKK